MCYLRREHQMAVHGMIRYNFAALKLYGNMP
jgi:hypothetical protein